MDIKGPMVHSFVLACVLFTVACEISPGDFVFPLENKSALSRCTFENGTSGRCMSASKCPKSHEEYVNGVNPTLCYFAKNEAVVCCVTEYIKQEVVNPPVTTESLEVMPEPNKIVKPIIPSEQLVQRRKSIAACEDHYSLPVPFKNPGQFHTTIVGGQVTSEGEFPHMNVMILTHSLSNVDQHQVIESAYNNCRWIWIMNELKQFLVRRPILSAFECGLQKLGLKCDVVEIRKCIESMQIYFCKSLGDQIQSITLRSGIMVSISSIFAADLKETVETLLTADGTRFKAYIITKCCHETAHFLARSFSNDYNFSSPKFCSEKDPDDETKLFEFGRYIELRLFGMQPNWTRSSEQAAIDFINNALEEKELPLICSRSDDYWYLVKRDKPSLSFAGDIEIIPSEGDC